MMILIIKFVNTILIKEINFKKEVIFTSEGFKNRLKKVVLEQMEYQRKTTFRKGFLFCFC